MIPVRGALAVALTLAAVTAAPGRAEERVRIAVATGVDRAVVEGAALAVTPLHEGAAPVQVRGGRVEIRLDGDTLRVDGAPVDAPGVLITAAQGLRAGGFPLDGEVEVRRAADGLAVVNALPLEPYVAAVTGAEMPPRFPPEALKAQAVAARTFAVFKKLEALGEGRPWHLGASVLGQVYRGARVDPRARSAADATAGEVLTYDHAVIEAYFHSTCGGATERGADALGRDLPYLPSVRCDRCRASPRSTWSVRVPAAELGRVAGLGRDASSVRVVARTASGRAARVEVAGGGRRATLSAVDLRQRLGFDRLPSLWFDAALTGGEARFDGRGSGHGAGLCQWGAAGAARDGQGYREILARYYPGTELVRMY